MIAFRFILISAVIFLFWSAKVGANSAKKQAPKFCENAPKAEIKKCPKNEEFQCCGACEQLSCNKRYSTVRCFRCPSACYCREGYIRQNLPNGQLGRCIRVEKCPAHKANNNNNNPIDAGVFEV